MADHFENANKSVRGMYGVFRKGAGTAGGTLGAHDANKIRARLVVENIFTLGLSNVVRLGVAHKASKSNELTKIINDRIAAFAYAAGGTFGLNPVELSKFLQYLYGTLPGNTMPEPNPYEDAAFDAGWQALTTVHSDVMNRFRGNPAAVQG